MDYINYSALNDEDLNIAVALSMGWKSVQIEDFDCFMVPPDGDPRIAWAAEWNEKGCPDWMEDWAGNYTDAFKLIKDFEDKGIKWEISGGIKDDEGNFYEVAFRTKTFIQGYACESSVTRAICIARLHYLQNRRENA
jgi:hypothetical protein